MSPARPDRSDLDINGAIQRLNVDICDAQAQLLARSSQMLAQLKSTEVVLPTAFRRTIDPDGEDRIEKVSETRVPLGSLVPLGVFYISSVDVEFPVSAPASDDTSTTDDSRGSSAAASESTTTASVRVSYQYRPLTEDVSTVTVHPSPFVDLRFTEFDGDAGGRRSCRATGIVEARDGESGDPLAGAHVLLSVEDGSVLPSSGRLDDQGEMEFRVTGPCERGGEFSNSVLVLVNGHARRFAVHLSSEGDRQSP